ncbi:caspase family protein [Lutibacter sp.]
MNYLRVAFLGLFLLPLTAFAQVHLLAMNADTEGLQYTGNDRKKIVKAFQQHYGKQLKVYEISNVSVHKFQQRISKIKKKLHRGDQVVVYFSGHGSTVLDRNKDEDDPWDEMVVFAKKERLVDDNFADYLMPFFKYHLTVILDSCNSGGMSKAIDQKRFIAKFLPTNTPSNAGIFAKQDMTAMLDHAQFKGVLIAAAKANQSAFEDREKQGGVFTHYFAQAFSSGKNNLQQSFIIARDFVAKETEDEQIPVIEIR